MVVSSRALRPAYFRFILTVYNRAAERFARLDGTATERAIRDAVQKTFRGAARDVQGVFAIHQHGGTVASYLGDGLLAVFRADDE